MYRITYRKMSGNTDVAFVPAMSESQARWYFGKKYDGRIIIVERIS